MAAPSVEAESATLLTTDTPVSDDAASRQAALASSKLSEGVLRGIALPTLLQGAARLFAENGEAARRDPIGTYALSAPADSLDYFLSHSWRCPRLFKYLALLVHFNLPRARIATVVILFVVFTYELFRFESVPSWGLFEGAMPVDGLLCTQPILCALSSPATFLLFLFFGHVFRSDVRLFLDISCISQQDEAQKQAGIGSLGAILDRSETLLVLCDGSYWSRLWCVFEVAVFSHRYGRERLAFIPLHTPLLIVAWAIAFCMYNYGVLGFLLVTGLGFPPFSEAWVAAFGPFGFMLDYACSNAVFFVPALFLVVRAQEEAHEIRRSLQQLRSFTLDSAHCFSAADRSAILSLISRWWTESDVEAGGGDDAQRMQLGCERFERFVRYDLARSVAPAVESGSIGLADLFAITICPFYAYALDLLATPEAGLYHVMTILSFVGLSLAGTRALWATSNAVASVGTSLRERAGWPAWAARLVVIVGLTLTVAVFYVVLLTAAFPAAFLDYTFRFPDDGLGDFGRKCLKFSIVAGMHAVAAALSWA